MEAQTTTSNFIQCGLLIGEYKTFRVSGVTFSFKEEALIDPLPPPPQG